MAQSFFSPTPDGSKRIEQTVECDSAEEKEKEIAEDERKRHQKEEKK